VIQPAENASVAELGAEINRRLESKLFKVDRITILEDEEILTVPTVVPTVAAK
jgi:hypothetical protein